MHHPWSNFVIFQNVILRALVSLSRRFADFYDDPMTSIDIPSTSRPNRYWNKPALIDGKVTMRLGGMHLHMAYIASIGKLYRDGGLLSMLVDSDVYAPATARLMLEGKQVSRGNRGMKLMLEALYRLYQEAFWGWMQQRDQTEFREEMTWIDL